MMESFGKENAGKEVTTAQFRAHVEKAAGKKVEHFFRILAEPDRPAEREAQRRGPGRDRQGQLLLTGKVHREPGQPLGIVEVVWVTEKGETGKKVPFEGVKTSFHFEISRSGRSAC